MEQKAWIIDEKTAKQYLTVEDAIDCVEKTWKWYGEGRVIMPNKITTDMSELGVAGWFNSMPAYIGPMDVAGIKVVGGYDGNKALGLPYIKANVLITDSKTGILRALISGDHINDLRTGAQPAVMARLLAAKTDVVTIIGTGLQGYMSLLCMSKVLDMKEIRVCDISEAAMDRFIARFPDAPFRFVKCKSNEEGCRGSDVIITVTNANADLVEEPWVKPGALVMTMGSFRETSFDVVRKADRIAVDQVGQSLHRGNVKELAEMGEITADSFDIIVPDVLAGKMPGRTDPNHRIYAQIIGTGFERGFHQLVFGVLFLRELDDALAFELPAHTAVFAHGPAALAHQMADFGHGTVTVVGRGFHDDGDAARTVTFVVDFYDVAAGILPGTLADGGFDFILGEVDRLGSSNGRTQAGITGRIAAVLGCDDDFLGCLGKFLTSLGILATFTVLDVGPFAVSRH